MRYWDSNACSMDLATGCRYADLLSGMLSGILAHKPVITLSFCSWRMGQQAINACFIDLPCLHKQAIGLLTCSWECFLMSL